MYKLELQHRSETRVSVYRFRAVSEREVQAM